MSKNLLSEEEAGEKLFGILEVADKDYRGEPTLGQLITSAVYSVSPESIVSWCPVCDREQEFCICDDEEAKKAERERQMKSEQEKEREAEAVKRVLRDMVSEEDLEEIKRKKKAQEDMEFCPICDTKRVEDLIYETEDGRIVGCQLCLDRPEEVVVS